MPFVELRGIESYYEVHGEGEPLVLLHGGFCSIETMRSQIGALSTAYAVHSPERTGHGRTADREGPASYEEMLADTLAYLDSAGLESAHIVGFSDGAIVGLLLASRHPERVRSLVSISGNLDPGGLRLDDEAPSDDESDSDGYAAQFTIDYNRLSPDGPEHADVVLAKLIRMWETEPRISTASLGTVRAPTLIMSGDRDTIRTDHSLLIADSIPGAQLCIVPGTTHMLMFERPAAGQPLRFQSSSVARESVRVSAPTAATRPTTTASTA